MAKDFYSALQDRRSIYGISPESKVSDERIAEVIKDAINYAPSAFNSQSARVILLLEEQHKKLWDITREALRAVVSPGSWQPTEDKIASFANGYGTILYFDDTTIIKDFQQKFPRYSDNFPIWAQQANGILQYMVWTSLQVEGFGASLQHYNPLIDATVKETWNVPDGWQLIAQMPFGIPTSYPDERSKQPIEERFVVYSHEAVSQA